MPVTDSDTSTQNDRMLQRVRALLAKAESTTFEGEAIALTAKAHELIAAHAIDLALVEEREGAGEVTTRLVLIPNPYPKEKFILLGGVARANRSRAILGVHRRRLLDLIHDDPGFFDHDGRYATIVGYPSDLDAVELLFTSLLAQAVNTMVAKGSQVDEYGENRTRSFRRSFLNSFAWTVRERLEATRDAASRLADADGPASVLPVLADRERSVEDHIAAEFGPLDPLRTSVSNYEGVVAGRDAARRADVGSPRISGRQRSLR